tara:strand:- start:3714 stop:4610 length:897 start_codon:yes stop_codon:yes gene_type:complete
MSLTPPTGTNQYTINYMYLNKYKINNTLNLDSNPCFSREETYPLFEEDLTKYKTHLKQLVEDSRSATFYKFGDGDYRFLKGIEIGSAKPGARALSKPYKDMNLEIHNEGALLCDYYTCEIYPENRKEFNEVINRDIDYPAEYGYGLIANKWLLREFKGKIGVIGAEPKIRLIQELLKYPEYQNYLGIDKFEDYIYFPQKFAADDLDSLEEHIKPQLQNSTSKIFLVGIGHAKSGILHRFSSYASSVYLDVGGGIDMIAGCISTKRPYAGSWTNYKLSNFDYSQIDYMNYNHGNEKLLR